MAVVVGYGSPIMDMVATVPAEFLAAQCCEPAGGSLPVTAEQLRSLLEHVALQGDLHRWAGGAGCYCNTDAHGGCSRGVIELKGCNKVK